MLPNSAQKKRRSLLTRVSDLEARISDLETEVRRLREASDDETFYGCIPPADEGPGRALPEVRRRGRRPQWDIPGATRRRIDLLNLLRGFWPALGPIFRPQISAEQRKAAMEIVFRGKIFGKRGQLEQAARHLLANYLKLDDFLCSDRYNGKPETIASAMAGVPHVRWSTSLKRLNSRELKGKVLGLGDYRRQ
jgi:hypothetical protein